MYQYYCKSLRLLTKTQNELRGKPWWWWWWWTLTWTIIRKPWVDDYVDDHVHEEKKMHRIILNLFTHICWGIQCCNSWRVSFISHFSQGFIYILKSCQLVWGIKTINQWLLTWWSLHCLDCWKDVFWSFLPFLKSRNKSTPCMFWLDSNNHLLKEQNKYVVR